MPVQPLFFPNSRPFEISEIEDATDTTAGAMSAADKAKLDTIPPGGGGTPGINAFTTTTATFVQPAIGANVVVNVLNSDWIAPTQILFQEAGGFYQAISLPSSTQVTLKNLGYTGNATSGVNVPVGTLSPGGLQGTGQQLAFGQLFTVSSAGTLNTTDTFFGVNGVVRGGGLLPSIPIDGMRINSSQSFSNFSATSTAFGGPTVLTVRLYASTDNGANYALIATVMLQIGTETNTTVFGPTTFPSGTLFCCYAVTSAGNFACGLSATVS